MNKEQVINKIVKDLPIKEMRSQMSDEEWYGWFEECWNKAINYNRCCTELKDKEVPTFSEWAKTLKFSSNGIKLYKEKELYNDELIEVYKKEINPLSL